MCSTCLKRCTQLYVHLSSGAETENVVIWKYQICWSDEENVTWQETNMNANFPSCFLKFVNFLNYIMSLLPSPSGVLVPDGIINATYSWLYLDDLTPTGEDESGYLRYISMQQFIKFAPRRQLSEHLWVCGWNRTREDVILGAEKHRLSFFTIFWHFTAPKKN